MGSDNKQVLDELIARLKDEGLLRPKPSFWEFLREKFAEALIGSLVIGLLAIVGWAIVKVNIDDGKQELVKQQFAKDLIDVQRKCDDAIAKMRNDVDLDLTQAHNDSVKREASLREELMKNHPLPPLPPFPQLPDPIGGGVPMLPPERINVQQSPAEAKNEWREKFERPIPKK